MSETVELAICAVARDESLYVEEWIAFHLLQGVGRVLIFDNDSGDGMPDMLVRIAEHAPVEVVRWPGSDYDGMQRAAYRDGALHLAGRAEWVAFIDIDEFVFSAGANSLPEELARLGRRWVRSPSGTASSARPAIPPMHRSWSPAASRAAHGPITRNRSGSRPSRDPSALRLSIPRTASP